MSRISDIATDEPQLRTGFGGHVYAFCKKPGPLEEIAKHLDRSTRSVYYRSRYETWALRIIRFRDKEAVRALFQERGWKVW